MLVARVYAESHEIDARLVPFGATRPEMIAVVKGVVAARSDTVENDPATAEGLLAYIFGTRLIRSLLRSKGWYLHRENNIEAVLHPDKPLKVIYQSVDLAASRAHRPQAVSGKGSGSDLIIAQGQGDLFSEEDLKKAEAASFDKIDKGAWYFCVSVNGDDVRAELSLPSGIENGNFKGFIERIFIVRDGEWPDLSIKPDDRDGVAEFEPVVTRK